MLKTAVQILLFSSVLLGLFSSEAFAVSETVAAKENSSEVGKSLEDILAQENAIVRDPNFPFGLDEIAAIFKEVDVLAPSLISSTETKFRWSGFKEPAGYLYYDDVLQVPKLLGPNIVTYSVRTPLQITKHKVHAKAIIAHEYGHALLHKNLFKDAPAFKKVAEINEDLHRKGIQEIPSDIYINTQVLLAYHEFFADMIAYAVTGDGDAIFKALKYAIGEAYGDRGQLAYRRFPTKVTPKMKKVVSEVILDAKENSRFDYYHAFLVQRPIIAQYMQNNPGQESKMIAIVYDVIREEADKWLALPSDKLPLQSVIESFDTKLKERLQ